MTTGIVRQWHDDKKYGWIERDDADADIFVHVTGLASGIESLAPGQRVSFEIGVGRANKPAAHNVSFIPDASAQ